MHRRGFAGISVASIALAIAVAGGCKVYEKDLLNQQEADAAVVSEEDAGHEPVVSDAGDGAIDSGEGEISVSTPASCDWGDCWWSTGGTDSCRSAGMPTPDDRPHGADGPSIPEIYLGFTELRVGSTNAEGKPADDAWEGFGFDLDGVCTNSRTCSDQTRQSCKAGGPSIPFDGELCRDNTFARLQPVIAAVPELGERFGLGEEVFNCELWRGGWNDLFRISGYSGEPNDPQVRVDYYRSTGIQDELAWKCPAKNFRTKYPRWLSSRKWGVVTSSLTGPITTPGTLPDATNADPEAFVKNGYLVARIPDGTEQGFIGKGAPYRGFSFKAQKSVFVGQLVKAQDGTWNIREGLIGGRIHKQDLIQAFRNIGFCETGELSAFYESMLTYVDENADVLADGTNAPDTSCDAMSYALGFQAAQLLPGSAVPEPARIECCLPEQSAEECSAICGDGTLSGAEKCDTKIAAGKPGACPTTCAPTDSCTPQVVQGSGCAAACEPMPITMAGVMDGCCPSGANATTDRDCAPRCSNGVVEAGETCDPPNTCKTCVSADPCSPVRPVGSPDTCNLRCEVTPITQCGAQDRCCPAGCTTANDRDCSASCGNGVVDNGETCETRGNGTLCPANCDDSNACTTDTSGGSVANCNLICTHTPIAQASNGDGCCPAGASALVDDDCQPKCGNKIIEGTEQCDDGNAVAGDGCADCKTETRQQMCLAALSVSDACAQCTCNKCTTQGLACYGAASANDVKLCRDMVDCGRASRCGDPDCFCGNAGLLTCLAGAGDGPCRAQVVAAAKTNSAFDIQSRSADTSYPLGRANAVRACVDSSCAAECGR